jgi:serine/threonine-protein kinase HipA
VKNSAYDAPACPGTLKAGFSTYNPSTINSLFNGHRVYHIIDGLPGDFRFQNAIERENKLTGEIWIRLKLVKNQLQPFPHGEYLLKTVIESPSDISSAIEMPANSHLCFRLANDVFQIDTIPNALIFFENGHPALLTKPAADFIAFEELAALKKEVFKKNYTCADLISFCDKHISANVIARDRLFTMFLFLWITGDRQNFISKAGVVQTPYGDFLSAPLHDIINSEIHMEVNSETGFPGGLFPGDKSTPEYLENGHYTSNEFSSLANRSGIHPARAEKILQRFKSAKTDAENMVNKAFLPDELKKRFWKSLESRFNRL